MDIANALLLAGRAFAVAKLVKVIYSAKFDGIYFYNF